MSGTQSGLQAIRFATQTAQGDVASGSHERLVNLFAEPAPAGSPSNLVLRSVPGLAVALALGSGPIVQVNEDSPAATYIASGTHLYRVTNPNGVQTLEDLGDVGSAAATNPGVVRNVVTSASGVDAIVVCVPPYAYAAKLTDTAVTKITSTDSGDFPQVQSVAYLGGFYVFTTPNSSQWFVSGALAPTTYAALDFAYADANPNLLLRVVSHLDRLWLMGQGGIEIWYLSGDQDFPFRLDAGGIINETVVSGASVAICDQSIFWVSNDFVVYRTNGYRAQRVSTFAIESQIQQYLTTNQIDGTAIRQAVSYSFEGHSCYALTIQGASDPGRTWVYDCSTQLWFERSSSGGGLGRWRVSCAGKTTFLGDAIGNLLFVHQDQVVNDAGSPTNRIAVSSPVWNNGERVFMSRLEVDTEHAGVPVVVDWSDDDCQSWRGQRTMIRNGGRCSTNRLGSTRRRTIRLQIPSGPVRIYGVYALIEGGAS